MKKLFPGMGATVLQVVIHPPVLVKGLRCIAIILKRFFLFQFKSALFPGRVPVSWIRHELDDRIPFNPRFVRIYLDFTGFWIRIVGFLCIRYRKKGPAMAVDFINSISRLYLFAFQIYKKNLSTTTRPRYTKTFYFRLIHLLDPHLMCLPSLHVMLVIQSYIRFREYVKAMGEEEALGPLTERVLAGAQVITDAVLYVKQHSINCVAAALYTMNRLFPSRFTTADAETFTYGLFQNGTRRDILPEYAPFYTGDLVSTEDIAWLREHIISLYRFFLETDAGNWKRPLLAYLSLAREKQHGSLYIFPKKDYSKERFNSASGEKNMVDGKSLVSRVVELGGREATVLENTNLRVMIDDIGGMVPELSGRRGGNGGGCSTGWINAHWMPWFRSNTGKPYSDAEHGSFWKSNLLYHIAGSFPCIPNFGPGHIAEGVPMPPHGWTSNQKWRYVTNDTDPESGAVWFLSVMESPDKGLPLSFSKIDALIPGQAIHYTSIRVRNRGPQDTEICAGWHNVVGPPFLYEGCRISGAAERWITPPPGGEFDTTTRLALGAEFSSLSRAPLLRGGKADLSIVPAPIGNTDFATGAVSRSAPLTWLGIVNPHLKMIYISFATGPSSEREDLMALYFNNLWMQYGGRPFTPWAPYEGGPDLSYCLGLENSISAFAYGLEFAREMRQVLGSPATVKIPGGAQKTLRSGVLFGPYEGGALDGGILVVQGEENRLACTGRETVFFTADPDFAILAALESHHV